MKKRKLKNLSLRKTTISNLSKNEIRGGNINPVEGTVGLRCTVTKNRDCKSYGAEVCDSEVAAGCWTWFFCRTTGCNPQDV